MSPIASSESRLGGLSADAFSSMFQAIGGLRNRRALFALLGCLVFGIVIGALLSTLGGFFAGALAALLYLLAVGTGINAAGLLQMDQARGVPLRSTTDALVAGLLCIPKLIVLGIAFALAAIVLFIAIALVFLVCKIPFFGPILYVVVFPLSVLAAGLTITGLVVCMVLSLPAIWEGSTIARALAQTFAIARSRLIEALLLLAFVGLLCFAVGLIAFGVIGTGLLPTVGMSASILGMGGIGGMGSMGGMGGGMAALTGIVQGFGGGYAIAGMIGFGVLWAIAMALVGQVYLQGLSLVYLRVTEGLDIGAAEAALQNTLNEARQRGGELAGKARNAAARDGSVAPVGSAVAGAAFAAPSSSASAWSAPVAAPSPSTASTNPSAAPPPLPTASSSLTSAALATSASPLSSPPSPAVSDATSPRRAASALPFEDDLPGDPSAPGARADWGSTTASVLSPRDLERTTPLPKSAAASIEPLDLDFDLLGAPSGPVDHTLASALASTPAAPAPSSPAAVAPSPAAHHATCPKCLAACSPDDIYCGVCGHRLT